MRSLSIQHKTDVNVVGTCVSYLLVWIWTAAQFILLLLHSFRSGPSFVQTASGNGGCSGSLIVHHLVWQSDGRAADEWALFVSPLQKIGQQFPFALHKDGPPPHEAEVVLLQDVVAFLHHLGGGGGTNVSWAHEHSPTSEILLSLFLHHNLTTIFLKNILPPSPIRMKIFQLRNVESNCFLFENLLLFCRFLDSILHSVSCTASCQTTRQVSVAVF